MGSPRGFNWALQQAPLSPSCVPGRRRSTRRHGGEAPPGADNGLVNNTRVISPLGRAKEVQGAEWGGLSLESAGTWGRGQPSVLLWKAGCCWQTHGVGVAPDKTGTGGQVTAGTLPDFILELCGASHSEGPVLGCRLPCCWPEVPHHFGTRGIVLPFSLHLQGSCWHPGAQAQPGAGVGAQALPTVLSWCVGGAPAWPSGWDLPSSPGRADDLLGAPFQGPFPWRSAPHSLTA